MKRFLKYISEQVQPEDDQFSPTIGDIKKLAKHLPDDHLLHHEIKHGFSGLEDNVSKLPGEHPHVNTIAQFHTALSRVVARRQEKNLQSMKKQVDARGPVRRSSPEFPGNVIHYNSYEPQNAGKILKEQTQGKHIEALFKEKHGLEYRPETGMSVRLYVKHPEHGKFYLGKHENFHSNSRLAQHHNPKDAAEKINSGTRSHAGVQPRFHNKDGMIDPKGNTHKDLSSLAGWGSPIHAETHLALSRSKIIDMQAKQDDNSAAFHWRKTQPKLRLKKPEPPKGDIK